MSSDRAPDPKLRIDIRRQPNDVTCGPTCLQAVYRFFEDDVQFADLLAQVTTLEHGGTLGILLASHALKRGYRVTIDTWNLRVFDPTWFAPGADPLRELLHRRASAQEGTRLTEVIGEYVSFLDGGGQINMRELGPELIYSFLERGVPALVGLSATYLYGEARELSDGTPDAVSGDPVGHFVLLTGFDSVSHEVFVTDPLHPNPLSEIHTYRVPIQRLVGAIYLGVLTHDANLIVIEPSAARPKGY